MALEKVSNTDVPTIDNEPVEDDSNTIRHKTKQTVTAGEAFGASPLEDRHGQHLWVRTRQCYCPDNAETDCRYHNVAEPGWEVCPFLAASQKDRKIRGRWLWARNPLYGKAPAVVEEVTEAEAA